MASEFANASAKRVAAQNERAIRNLRLGMFISLALSVGLRLFLRPQTFTSIFSIASYILTCCPVVVLYLFLVRAGTPRRGASGSLIAPGDDLNQPGLTEWSWDIIYISWVCQVFSSIFGAWVWWLYIIIPIYAGYKVWTSFISPKMQSGVGDAEPAGETSKRQEKLRKRQEKGDLRVRTVPRK